jgi:dTDP-4-dehydrorhamnose reductase
MKILITGGGGQLARSLEHALAGHDVSLPDHAELDVADGRSAHAAIDDWRPDLVIHTAALTDTARCEREPELAMSINACGTEHVARAARSAGSRLIVVSTNEVFDGASHEPYAEEAPPYPLNAYGRSKLEGERRAQEAHSGAVIVRTAWVFGHGHMNFVEKVRAAAREGRPLRFVTDEIATPTSSDDLAAAIAALAASTGAAGIYHLTNDGEASRWEWAAKTLRLAGHPDAELVPITTDELRRAGYDGPRKPPYSVLANRRARDIGITLPHWHDALARYLGHPGATGDE